jgi:predicted dehydrogenase
VVANDTYQGHIKITMKTTGKLVSRRRFLKHTGLVPGALLVVRSGVLGLDGEIPPSEKIAVGTIGCGGMGSGDTKAVMRLKDCQVIGGADVDGKHRESFAAMVNKGYGNSDCKMVKDFRELLAMPGLDAVIIATPDHWHAVAAVAALKAGKDVYGEKPLARTIQEQQAIVKNVAEHKRIWQTGSQQRSDDTFHKAAEIVRNGLIGKIKEVHVGLPDGHSGKRGSLEVATPPEWLDYDLWCGPSQVLPYVEARTHWGWRWNYNTGGGQLLDWIGHHCDIAHWGMDADGTGPVEVKPISAEFPPADAVLNTATKYRTESKYADGTVLTISGGHPDIKMGCKWIGTDGWVWVTRGGFESSNADFKKFSRLPEAQRKVSLFDSPGHHRNWVDCIRSRKETICPAATAHRSATVGHLALISLQLNRTLKWDPVKETIEGDPEASKRLGRELRGPWKI